MKKTKTTLAVFFLILCLFVLQTPAEAIDFDIRGEKDIGGGFSVKTESKRENKQAPPGIISGRGLKAGLDASSGILDKTISHHNSLSDIVVGWTNFLLPFVSILAILGLIVGGFFLITGYGNDSLYQKGRKIVLYSILGIIIIYSAYPIISTIIRADSSFGGIKVKAGINF